MDDGFLISSSSSARKGINKGRFDFKTSIDPEFLSLFANWSLITENSHNKIN